jgi:hypothetical protein
MSRRLRATRSHLLRSVKAGGQGHARKMIDWVLDTIRGELIWLLLAFGVIFVIAVAALLKK